MAPKRKTRGNLLEFDPNKSDSDDENFEPEVDDRSGRPRKRPRGGNNGKPHRRAHRYRGSDIDEDDDDLSNSEEEGSFHEDEEDDEPLVNANTGRRVRKAAAKQTNYKESTDDEDEVGQDIDTKNELTSTSPQKTQRPSKVITIKFNAGKKLVPRANPAIGTRRTRARTAEVEGGNDEVELVELSNSGRHVRLARGSKSRSPETAIRRRTTRGGKGLKQPSPLPEVVQEDTPNADEADSESVGQEAEKVPEPAVEPNVAAVEDEPMQTVEANEDGDDDDDIPINRRTRARHAADNPVELENDNTAADSQIATGRRLTRGRSRAKKGVQEPSSDFEPGNDSEEDNDFGSEGKGAEDENDDAESSPSRRGKRSPGKSRRSSRKPRVADESGEEELFNQEELAEELENLREDSQSAKRSRRRSPEILFEEKTRRRRVKKVDYSILPLNQANFEIDEDEGEAPISTPARRRGRANAATYSTRALHTLAGPFGGVSGEGALAEGPWGNDSTGAAGLIESDSSDDEANVRSGGAGNPSATPRGLLGGGGQLANGGDAHGSRIGTLAPNVGKVKDHKALADADPLGVDLNVNFSQVGGMEGHIEQLKEMVQLPLLYPDMFTRFHVTPPRGVLFHGPPGTGKTLLARALANSVGFGGRKITFYMRKGADALSKWVGEAEKQLRLLFEEARKTQPSIIFFDEIDGLAPVRSSKQEQIHASIVSTLLALMDGMDGRGQVIVIGATNRPDNIDPALRRPGRFDREFYFPLPDVDARKAILEIHTRDWGLSEDFKMSLAKDAKGYGGADLRALCTEAALNAIQRTYPQIYLSKEKLVVDPEKVDVKMTDFVIAKKKIVPSSERSSTSGAASLPVYIEPLLRHQFKAITDRLDSAFPRKPKVTALDEAMYEPYKDKDFGFSREQLYQEFDNSRVFRPRLLVYGVQGMGQSYISAAILHYFEGVHVQNFDLPTIIGDSRPPEQVLTGLFVEVKRQKPSVIFIPNVDTWYNSLSGPALTAFLGMLRSLHPTDPVMLLGTTETELNELGSDLRRDLFGFSRSNVIEITRPAKENREEYFSRIIAHIKREPNEFPDPVHRKKRQLEELPIAPPPPPKKLTKEEIHNEDIRYRQALNMMKVHLQPIMDQISKKYQKFRHPVILESQYQYLLDEADPNYVRADVTDAPPRPYELAKDGDGYPGLRETATGKFFYNLDVNIIETRLANGFYWRPYEFLKDVRALKSDAENIGDRQRWLKASELMANVEVDVLDVDEKLRNMGINWERLYETHKKRREVREERARKKKAMQSVLDAARSSASNSGGASQHDSHPLGLHTTTAQFQVIGDRPNSTAGVAASNAATNGTSVPSRTTDEDIQMGNSEDYPGRPSPMQPPSQWPRIPPRPLGTSTMATIGGKTQISQVSAVQSLPPGVSPSALLNDASTTRTSDPSNRSSGPSTQLTNGFQEQSGPETMPDTLRYSEASQLSSSDEPWFPSQAHGILRGYLPQPGFSQDSQIQASPAAPKPLQASGIVDPLGGPSSGEGSQRQSQQVPQVELDEISASFFLVELTKRTSGCTIEQLEQINRDLMSKLWETRGEHNRMKVLTDITRVFNETMQDIEEVQQVLQLSQD